MMKLNAYIKIKFGWFTKPCHFANIKRTLCPYDNAFASKNQPRQSSRWLEARGIIYIYC